MRTIAKRIISTAVIFGVTLSSVCGGVRIHGVTPEVKEALAAGNTGKYVKNIMISYASSKEDAEKELGEDYIVLDKNFNDGMSGDSWIGYSTTDDADIAIKDIKAMPMDGRFSTSDYDELLNNQKKVVETQVEAVIPVIIEYTKNCNERVATAETARKLLNAYHEDDSDMNMGDFLLEKGNALIKDKRDSAAIKDLQKIYLQGNNYAISTIEGLLAMVQGTNAKKNGSWITRMSILGPDGLYNSLKRKYPDKSKTSITNYIKDEYIDDADKLYKEIPVLREILKNAQNSEIVKAEGNAAAIESIISDISGDDIEEVPFDSDIDKLMDAMYQQSGNGVEAAGVTSDLTAYSIEKMLKETPYGKGKTLYDFFMNDDLKKGDLYTMAYVLSSGQMSSISSVGIYPLFENALVDYADRDSEPLDDVDFGENMFSIYEGIDRSVFEGDTAITAETLKSMETKQINDPLSKDSSGNWVLLVGGLILSAGLTGAAIRSFTTKIEKMKQDYAFCEKKAVLTMKDNIKMMKTYDNAWKVIFLENKGYIDHGTMYDIRNSENVGREIEKAYNKAITEMKATNPDVMMAAEKVEQYGAVEKQQFMKKYSSQIKVAEKNYDNALRSRGAKVPRAGWTSRIAFSLAAVLAIAFTGYEIYCMVNKGKVNFVDIPGKVVARTYEGNVEYLTYHVATTKSGDKADIHNKKGKGWQALYTTTDDRMGDPILTSSLSVQLADSSSDQDMIPVTYFDEGYAADLTDDIYTGAKIERACIFFKRGTEPIKQVGDTGEKASTEAAVFGGAAGMIWIILILLVVVGGAAGVGIYIRKRKRS